MRIDNKTIFSGDLEAIEPLLGNNDAGSMTDMIAQGAAVDSTTGLFFNFEWLLGDFYDP